MPNSGGATWRDFWYTLRYGRFYFEYEPEWRLTTYSGYCDGWHFCLWVGPLYIEVS